jgi:hypothetical protein
MTRVPEIGPAEEFVTNDGRGRLLVWRVNANGVPKLDAPASRRLMVSRDRVPA